MLPEQNRVRLIRHRYIPAEYTALENDEIVFYSEHSILTKWQVLKPRTDFSHGCSLYDLKKGYKISRFTKENGELLYYYCDIIQTEVDMNSNTITFHDLLVDVIVHKNGKYEILDLEELALALCENIIEKQTLCLALQRLDALLQIIYDETFFETARRLDNL